MKKEIYKIEANSVKLKIANSEIASIKEAEKSYTGMRLIEDEKIGVAGAMGKYSEKELEDRAKLALQAGITYPYPLESDKSMEIKTEKFDFDPEWFLNEITDILEILKKENDDLIFSNMASMNKGRVSLENTEGLNLCHSSTTMGMGLVYKERASANIMDGFVGFGGMDYDREIFLSETREFLEARRKIMEIKSGTYNVIVGEDYARLFLSKILTDLSGQAIGTGASIFKDKMGTKAFSENFTLLQSTEVEYESTQFFDDEGCYAPDFKLPLIEKGVLKRAYADKRTADRYKLEHTFSAGGNYDSVPSLSLPGYRVLESNKNLKELLGGDPGIFVVMAAGGDTTSTGDFATPVQLAFLHDGEKFLGKVPGLRIRSNIYKMFGADFSGVSSESLSRLSINKPMVVKMQVDID